ncbi:MAG: hypothetical protein P8168_02620 [Deltaproteobacteria bacterium]|jgi:hypothetical protein
MITREEQWGEVMVVPPPQRQGVSWEDPELPGWLGFYRTLRDLLVRPGDFFENLGAGGWAEPLSFALIVSTAGLGFSLFWDLLILAGGAASNAAKLASSLNLGAEWLMALMIATPFLVLVDLAVGGLCWWGSLALAGAGREFTPGWRIFCYAQGGMVMAAIPILGSLVAAIWVLALMYFGAKRMFRLSALSALGSLAIFLTFEIGLGILLLLGLIVCLVGLAGLNFLALLG